MKQFSRLCQHGGVMHLKSHILDLTNQLKTIFGCFIYYFLEDEVSRFLIHWTPLCWISTEFLSRSVQTYHFQVPYSIFPHHMVYFQ